MNEIFAENFKIFDKEGLGSVRTLIKEDGEVWFVAKDACAILGIEKPENAYARLDDDEKRILNTCITGDQNGTHGGARKATIISESGLYSLVLTSRKPNAKAFKRWVTHEVLPSIRKNGGYIMGQEVLPETQCQMLEGEIKTLSAECNRLAKEKEQLAWEADMFSRYYDETLNLYKELKAQMATQEKKQEGAPVAPAKKDPLISAKVILPEKFVDQYGNVYFTRESAIEAIKAMRE